MTGTLKRVLLGRGFCFALGDDGIDYFISAVDVRPRDDFNRFKEGDRVEFTATDNSKGPKGVECSKC